MIKYEQISMIYSAPLNLKIIKNIKIILNTLHSILLFFLGSSVGSYVCS